jgi:septal ring factor EnvC (AmiA/AmiB activator)
MQVATLARPAYSHWLALEVALCNALQAAHQKIHLLIKLGSELTNEQAAMVWGRIDKLDSELNLVRARIKKFKQQDVSVASEPASWETLMDTLQAQLTESIDTVEAQEPAYS